ncbi:hypothetical protein ACX9NE_05260 [Mycobacterium sp. ML4]
MSFDPSVFKKFSDDKYQSIRQRINAVHRQCQMEGTSTAPLVVDWSREDAVLQELSRNQVEQTWDENKRRLCANTIDEHLSNSDPEQDKFPAGPCALFGFDPRIRFSLAENTVESLIEEYLSERYRYVCDVGVSTFCDTQAFVVQALGFGEWACLYRFCKHCWCWFDLPQEQREKTQKPGWPFPHPGQEFRHPAT